MGRCVQILFFLFLSVSSYGSCDDLLGILAEEPAVESVLNKITFLFDNGVVLELSEKSEVFVSSGSIDSILREAFELAQSEFAGLSEKEKKEVLSHLKDLEEKKNDERENDEGLYESIEVIDEIDLVAKLKGKVSGDSGRIISFKYDDDSILIFNPTRDDLSLYLFERSKGLRKVMTEKLSFRSFSASDFCTNPIRGKNGKFYLLHQHYNNSRKTGIYKNVDIHLIEVDKDGFRVVGEPLRDIQLASHSIQKDENGNIYAVGFSSDDDKNLILYRLDENGIKKEKTFDVKSLHPDLDVTTVFYDLIGNDDGAVALILNLQVHVGSTSLDINLYDNYFYFQPISSDGFSSPKLIHKFERLEGGFHDGYNRNILSYKNGKGIILIVGRMFMFSRDEVKEISLDDEIPFKMRRNAFFLIDDNLYAHIDKKSNLYFIKIDEDDFSNIQIINNNTKIEIRNCSYRVSRGDTYRENNNDLFLIFSKFVETFKRPLLIKRILDDGRIVEETSPYLEEVHNARIIGVEMLNGLPHLIVADYCHQSPAMYVFSLVKTVE